MRAVLVVSLALNLLVVLGLGAFVVRKGGVGYVRTKFYEFTQGSPYGTPGDDGQGSLNHQRVLSLYDAYPIRPGDVVFFGDSHAEFGPWVDAFGTARVRNWGLAGENTDGALARLGRVIAGRPAAVFVSIGSNDVAASNTGRSVEETVANVRTLLERLRAGSPATAVYLLATLPKGRTTVANLTETPLSQALNARYAELAPALGATYVDLATPLSDPDGTLRLPFTFDGAHLNAAGYAVAVEAVRPFVEAALAQDSPSQDSTAAR